MLYVYYHVLWNVGPNSHHFYYSSAGHEPGFYYKAQDDQFHDLTAKSILLGID